MSREWTTPAGLLVLDEEQEQFREMARQVVDKEAPLSRFRQLRDSGGTHDAPLWHTLSGLGWPAVMFAECAGGLGLSLVEGVQLAEALGRNLAATPLLSTLMSGALDTGAGIQSGRVVALAWQEEVRRRDPAAVSTRVEGGKLVGCKVAVLDAGAAQAFIVSAMVDGELRLFRVEAVDAVVQPLLRLDSRDAGNVRFEGAPATRLPGGLPELARALDIGTIALSAEMLGGAASVLERTLAWLHERQQFDVPLGSFQVLQHRSVDLFIGLELGRSAVMAAAHAAHAAAAVRGGPLAATPGADEHDPSVAALASLAKAKMSDTFLSVAREAIQMHGGIGMTDECDIGFFLKRAAVAAETLGNAAWHRGRWAKLQGY